MSDLLLLRGLLFAGECLLASALLPVFAFAVTALLRRRAALRHLAWTTMFGVLALLPLAALLLPPRRMIEHIAAPAAAVLPQAMPVLSAPVMTAPAAAAPAIAAPMVTAASLFTLENIALLLAALWLAGLAWQGLRLCVGGLGLMRLRRRSAPFTLHTGTGCDVRLAPAGEGPSTFGILRPIVLLPQAALGWPSARLEAVLRHEAAHIRRRDTASLLLARLVCALYWPNPLLWLAARAARRDAEIAADDAVLASGMTPSLYAAELLGLAAESFGQAPGIAMAAPPLAQRVEAVLAQDSSRKGVSRMDMAKTVCFGLAATLLLGAARFDIAVAQDAAPLPAPPAPVAAMPAADQAIETQDKAAAAQAERVKARADRVAAAAKAKAEAETDPVKREEYRAQAAQVAVQSEKVKAEADKAAAQYAVEARRHMALAFQLADEVRQKAQLQADRARLDAEGMRLAQGLPRPDSQGEASADAESQSTINGVTTTRRSGVPQNADSSDVRPQVQQALADARVGEAVARALAEAHIGETISKALADAHMDETTRKAIQDAHIEERIREAMAQVQPKIEAAMARAQRRAATMPPVPPMPALAPPPPLPEITPVPPAPRQN